MSDGRRNTSLLVAVACGVVAVVAFVTKVLGEDLGLGPGSITTAEAIGYFAFATCPVALWVHRRYPTWILDSRRPGGLPVLNEESRKQPLWLLVASMIVPLPAVAALLLGVGLAVLLLGASSGEVALDPASGIVGLLSVVVTSGYAFVVATRRQRSGEGSRHDLLGSTSALASVSLTPALLAALVSSGGTLTSQRVLAGASAAAVFATASYALIVSGRFRPYDKWGRAEPLR